MCVRAWLKAHGDPCGAPISIPLCCTLSNPWALAVAIPGSDVQQSGTADRRLITLSQLNIAPSYRFLLLLFRFGLKLAA